MSDGKGGGGGDKKKTGKFPVLHPPTRHCTNPLPVKHLITIQDGGIKSLIYLAFHSKITPAMQASFVDDRFASFITQLYPSSVKGD